MGSRRKLADFAGRGRRRFAAGRCAEECSVLPVERFRYERHDIRAASAEENGIDRNAFGIFPFLCDDGTLFGRRGEAGIGVSCRAAGLRIPWPPQPVDQLSRFLVRHAFPPDVAVGRDGAIGENRILRDRQHRVRIRLHAGSGRDAEESGFRIDGIKPPIRTELHPRNVVADGFDFPAGTVEISIARFVLPQADGNAPVTYFTSPCGLVNFRISMCSASQPSSRACTEAMRSA